MIHESVGYTMSTIEEGMEATLRLILSPELDGVTGAYFDGLHAARAANQAYDLQARQRLWRLSEELVSFATSDNARLLA
jgi:hypothetical protein